MHSAFRIAAASACFTAPSSDLFHLADNSLGGSGTLGIFCKAQSAAGIVFGMSQGSAPLAQATPRSGTTEKITSERKCPPCATRVSPSSAPRVSAPAVRRRRRTPVARRAGARNQNPIAGSPATKEQFRRHSLTRRSGGVKIGSPASGAPYPTTRVDAYWSNEPTSQPRPRHPMTSSFTTFPGSFDQQPAPVALQPGSGLAREVPKGR